MVCYEERKIHDFICKEQYIEKRPDFANLVKYSRHLWRSSTVNVIHNVLCIKMYHIVGLVQERRNPIANTLELQFSCTNLSIWDADYQKKSGVALSTRGQHRSQISQKILYLSQYRNNTKVSVTHLFFQHANFDISWCHFSIHTFLIVLQLKLPFPATNRENIDYNNIAHCHYLTVPSQNRWNFNNTVNCVLLTENPCFWLTHWGLMTNDDLVLWHIP